MIEPLPAGTDAAWHGPLTTAARGYLWTCAAGVLCIAGVMGLALAAGPAREGGVTARYFAAGAGVTLALHAGHLLAPWLAGTSRWAWAAWLLEPMAAFALLAMFGSRATRAGRGGSEWRRCAWGCICCRRCAVVSAAARLSTGLCGVRARYPREERRCKRMGTSPRQLDLKKDKGLTVAWQDGTTSYYSIAFLRACPPRRT